MKRVSFHKAARKRDRRKKQPTNEWWFWVRVRSRRDLVLPLETTVRYGIMEWNQTQLQGRLHKIGSSGFLLMSPNAFHGTTLTSLI